MRRYAMHIAITIAVIGIYSCGTGKKLDAANKQVADLNTQLSAANAQISSDKAAIDQLKKENIQYGKEAEDCRKAKQAADDRIERLNKHLQERGTSLEALKEKAKKAFAMLRDAGAEVHYKNGRIHVVLPDKLVFPSGSTRISDQGRQALSVVADVMIENPSLQALIISNTDSIPIRKAYPDNLSLSTERSNAIFRTLRDTYKIDPTRLTAAGRGRHDPIADNATAEGRAQNRRSEIIIDPGMDRLWKMMMASE